MTATPSIPLHVLNTLHSFALKYDLRAQDMSYHQPKMSMDSTLSEEDRASHMSKWIPIFTPKSVYNNLRWFVIDSHLRELHLPLLLSCKKGPSVLVCFRGSSYQFEHGEISLERLGNLLSSSCCICMDPISEENSPHTNCEKCQAAICFRPCLLTRLSHAQEEWPDLTKRNKILRHFTCPLCRHLSVKDLQRIHQCVQRWEGFDIQKDEELSIHWINVLHQLYLDYQKEQNFRPS